MIQQHVGSVGSVAEEGLILGGIGNGGGFTFSL